MAMVYQWQLLVSQTAVQAPREQASPQLLVRKLVSCFVSYLERGTMTFRFTSSMVQTYQEVILHGLLYQLDLKSFTKVDSKVICYSWIAACKSQAMAG